MPTRSKASAYHACITGSPCWRFATAVAWGWRLLGTM